MAKTKIVIEVDTEDGIGNVCGNCDHMINDMSSPKSCGYQCVLFDAYLSYAIDEDGEESADIERCKQCMEGEKEYDSLLIESKNNSDVECPYCGCTIENMDKWIANDGVIEIVCGHCDHEIEVERIQQSKSYSSYNMITKVEDVEEW